MTQKDKSTGSDDIMVVGLGASAGGLKALEDFFDALPKNTGMAFVVIVHLAPDHESSMTEILQEHTSLTVNKIEKRTKIRANNVYIIPPGKLLKLEDDHLVLFESQKNYHKLTTIDTFFRSLGTEKGSNSACVIFSGSGSDGSVGLKTVKEYGGVVIAQNPLEAGSDGMPRSAIDTGLVDLTLSVRDIPAKLIDYSKSLKQIKIVAEPEVLPDDETTALRKIFSKINLKTGHNFSQYKRKSVLRRIERRMRVNHLHTLAEYLDYINSHSDEVQKLFKDLLISVTNFFRDQDAFVELENKVIPALFKDKTSEDSVRVWVPRCATGEEAYSIAIMMLDFARTLDNPPKIQIFATDIDQQALETAREGRHPESIALDIPEERLERYFNKDGYVYQIKPTVTNIMLFAEHDLLKAPPFSKLDLISCRNLLIYLDRDLQSKVFNLFHYALNSGKWLFLGMSDSILEATELFIPVSKECKIYQQSPLSNSSQRLPRLPFADKNFQPPVADTEKYHPKQKSNIGELHHRILAGEYAPPSAIINKNYDLIHSTPNIERFLKYRGGEPSQNILKMVTPKLNQPLRRILFQAEQNESDQQAVSRVQIRTEEYSGSVKLIVKKVTDHAFPEGLLQVIFHEEPVSGEEQASSNKDTESQPETDSEIILALEDELKHTQEQLQMTVEEYETSNEELRASNEELQSMNEELQSTTEQLQTSQEEVQSVNEELKSVNLELENRIKELHQSNSDLKNLMEATDIATIFVDRNYCIQFYTNRSADIFNLIPSDVGRPIKHITHQLQHKTLLNDIGTTLSSHKQISHIVKDDKGYQYIMRIMPYRTIEDKFDGVILTFVNVSELKQAESSLRDRAHRQESLAELGLYALKEQNLQDVIDKAIQCLSGILPIDYCLVFHITNEFEEEEEEEFSIELLSSNLENTDSVPDKIPTQEKWDFCYALQSSENLIINNYQQENRYQLLPVLADLNVTSGLLLNLGGIDKQLGVLGVYSKKTQEFSEQDIHFTQVVANIIGSTIERHQAIKVRLKINERLQEEIKRSEQFQRDILDVNVMQRWEIGDYLHDNLAQVLGSMNIYVNEIRENLSSDQSEKAINKIDELKTLLDKQIDEIRDLSHDTIPVNFEEESVSDAFSYLMKQTQKTHQVTCSMQTDGILDKLKNGEVATHLYHITEEAIKNAINHGKAQNIKVIVSANNVYLNLQILDDGIGLNPEKQQSGMGLRIMQHRTELIGGSFGIEILDENSEFATNISCLIPLELINEELSDNNGYINKNDV